VRCVSACWLCCSVPPSNLPTHSLTRCVGCCSGVVTWSAVVKFRPDKYDAITPYLCINPCIEAIEFYTKAFSAKEASGGGRIESLGTQRAAALRSLHRRLAAHSAFSALSLLLPFSYRAADPKNPRTIFHAEMSIGGGRVMMSDEFVP
jgi:uncharacterized glyoxalase superfamily protein PhnB